MNDAYYIRFCLCRTRGIFSESAAGGGRAGTLDDDEVVVLHGDAGRGGLRSTETSMPLTFRVTARGTSASVDLMPHIIPKFASSAADSRLAFHCDLLAKRDVAAVEDEDDAVERDGAALLAQIPKPHEVVVGRVALDLRRRRGADLRERLGRCPLGFFPMSSPPKNSSKRSP